MRLSLRVFLGFFLIVALAAYFVLNIFMQEVKPGVRQGMEVALVDTANLLAEVAAEDLKSGSLADGRFARSLERYRARDPHARIWGLAKQGSALRVYVTDGEGRLLFDSSGQAPGADYSGWNDVYLTLRGQYGVRSTRTDPKDERTSTMYVAAPILAEGRIVGVLTVSTPTASVMPYAQRSERRVVRAGLALAGGALLVGLALSLWLTGAIGRLRAYAREVSEGRKAVLPPLSGELAELGRALETMREKLEGRQYVERYVHTLTHEMKSPLAAIHGAAELLEEDMPGADRRRFMANIREQEERLQRLVERMLGLATLENRRGLDGPVWIDLGSLVGAVISAKEVSFRKREIRVESSLPEQAWVLGEAFLLEQALSNLLDNALEFSPAGGRIDVRLESQGAWHRIVVKDEGPGVPDFALDRVFEAFYSLARPDTGKKSIGLGLSFVREVAQLHGGTVELANGEQGGAVARFSLPRV